MPTKRKDIPYSKEELWEIFDYKDGDLYWKSREEKNNRDKLFNKKIARKKAGFNVNITGYCIIKIYGEKYFAHRLVYKMFYGDVPFILDHIDGNTSNNKIENLREATHNQNIMNAKTYKTSSTGRKGVAYRRKTNNYQAKICVNNKEIYLGMFKTFEEAVEARKMAEEKYFGEFASPEGR